MCVCVCVCVYVCVCVCVFGVEQIVLRLGWRPVHTGVSGQPNASSLYSSHLAYVHVYHTCIYDTIYVAVTLSKHMHTHPDAVHSVLFKALWF